MVNLTPVAPAAPAAPYIGGKRVLSKTIIAKINATPHEGYAEVFVGMGGVFLRRDLQPRMEVINDISGDVANLFRILQRHYPQFMETLRFQITSRREFERLSNSILPIGGMRPTMTLVYSAGTNSRKWLLC